MRNLLWCGALWFAGRLTAQLVLPEEYHPENNPPPRRESPPTETPPPNPKQDEAFDQLRNQMRSLSMQSQSLTGLQAHPTPPKAPSWPRDKQILHRMSTGPERLRVSVKLANGADLEGELPNQTLQVHNAAGALPLRLHELSGLRPDAAEGTLLEFASGDRLPGRVEPEWLELTLPDGSTRSLRVTSLHQLAVLPPSP